MVRIGGIGSEPGGPLSKAIQFIHPRSIKHRALGGFHLKDEEPAGPERR